MHIPWLRPRYKIALLTLGWVLWFLVGGIEITHAQTRVQCNNNQYVYNWDYQNPGNISTLQQQCAQYGDTVAGRYTTQTAPPEPAPTSPPASQTTSQSAFPEEPAVGGSNPYSCPGCADEQAVGRGLSNPVSTQQPAGDYGTGLEGQGGVPASTNVQQAPGGAAGAGSGLQQAPAGAAGTTPVPATASNGSSVRLTNPLSGINSIPDLLAAILNVVIIIAIPIIILFIMLAGFKYVTARGNAAQVQEASTALLYAVIGGVIIIGATAIAQIIKNLVNAFAAP